jgi:hypothetical protein
VGEEGKVGDHTVQEKPKKEKKTATNKNKKHTYYTKIDVKKHKVFSFHWF